MQNKELEKLLLTVQKPGRYTGGECGSVIKNKDEVDVRFAFCFPDTYEVGMSHLGMKILYSLFNSRDDIWCERVFAPWVDFEQVMRENNIPLYALESGDSLDKFDFVGFTVQYEMAYTNILNMLNLGGVPVKSADRKGFEHPIVVAGGPCTYNPEPIADFIDIFFLGEGEEVDLEVIDLYKKFKAGGDREAFLKAAAQIEGVYVPSLYDITYNEDGTVREVAPKDNAPAVIKKRIMKDMDKSFYPDNMVVPLIEIIHDRVSQEIFRGCIRGCRFCQAGYIYRPVREKSYPVINEQARELCRNTGYDEISLASLSTSDYTQLEPLLTDMLKWTEKDMINLSLPSLRIDNFPKELVEKTESVRKSGLTFAPEAGTQRLRDVINKNITEEDIMSGCRMAFEQGHTSVKLYFMIGLPTETDEDIAGIANLAQKVVDLYYSLPTKPKGKSVNVSVAVSTFVPKPFTPFQFAPQISREEILRRQRLLRSLITTRKVSVSCHDCDTSFAEAILARGDRRLCDVVVEAYNSGCKFDSWDDQFSLDKWLDAFRKVGLDPEFYANRERDYNEILPWDHIDCGVTKKFFIQQDELAKQAVTTPNCREKCANCGAAKYKCGVCFEKGGDKK